MRETHTPITVFTLQLPKIYSKEEGKIQLKKGDELGKENMQEKKIHKSHIKNSLPDLIFFIGWPLETEVGD